VFSAHRHPGPPLRQPVGGAEHAPARLVLQAGAGERAAHGGMITAVQSPLVRRRLLNVLTALSLLLCVAAVGLWTWTQWRIAQARIVGAWHEVHVVARPGGVYLAVGSLHGPQPTAGWAFGHYSARLQDREWGMSGSGHWSFLGLRTGTFLGAATSSPVACTVRYVVLPHWLIAAIAAVMPAQFLRRQERRLGRRKKGGCASCGYDLRATPGRCPECGTTASVFTSG
jgi:hypothetical protein